MATCVTVGIISVTGLFALLIGVAAVIGMFLPKEQVYTRADILPRDVRTVYGAVRDVERMPSWRRELARVEVLSSTRYRTHGSGGGEGKWVDYEITTDEPQKKLVTRIAKANTPEAGWWTYQFEPVPEGTRLTLTVESIDEGFIGRTLTRWVKDGAIRMYLDSLRKHLS